MDDKLDWLSFQSEPQYEGNRPILLYVNSEPHKCLLRLLGEQVTSDEGETWLWLAVLGQAFFDAYLSVSAAPAAIQWRDDARKYLDSKNFDNDCRKVGLNPSWVQHKMVIFSALAADQRQLQRKRRVQRVETRQRRQRQLAL